jgi:hypothetical protein
LPPPTPPKNEAHIDIYETFTYTHAHTHTQKKIEKIQT